MSEQGLAVYQNFDTLQRAALALHESGYFKDSINKAQAIVKVMAGAELGLPPFASMSGIHIIQGKPTLGANIIATLVKNDPRYDYQILECDDSKCVIEWYENGKVRGTSSFTIQEAQRITTKENNNFVKLTETFRWKSYPSDMLFARAISRGARRYAPGIFGGSPVYTPDELNVDTDEEGYINSEHTVIEDRLSAPSNNDQNLVDVALAEGGEISMEDEAVQQYSRNTMSLETAEAVTSSDGTRYGDLPTDKLAYMANAIQKAMKKNGMSHEKHEEHQMKLDAIRVILSSRDG